MSEMTATRMARPGRRLATLTVCAAAWLVAAVLLWQTDVPRGLQLPRVDESELMSVRELDRAADFRRSLRVLFLAGTTAAVAWLVLFAWLAPRLPLPRGRIRAGITLVLAGLAGLWLVSAPFRLLAQRQRRRYDLSEQGYLERLFDPWLFLLGEAALACLAVAAAMVLAERLGRRWWVAGGLLLAGLGTAAVLAQPLLLSPRLEPLANRPRLEADIKALAKQLGVGSVRVEVREAKKRTKVANAEAIGIGPTRRVILWDTLFQGGFAADEIRVLAGHELAHVARSHLWKGLAWLALLSLPIAFVVARVTELRGGMAVPAAVPLALLTVVLLQLVLQPAVNVLSRRYEAEADWVALREARSPAAAERLFERLAATSLSEPDPPAWAQVLFGTHPTTVDRVAMARAWAAQHSNSAN